MRDKKLDWLSQRLSTLSSIRHLYLTARSFITSNDLSSSQILPLASVQVLTLLVSNPNHDYLASRHWKHILPSLQVVVIFQSISTQRRCSLCALGPRGRNDFYGDYEDFDDEVQWDNVQQCVHQLMQPFKQCSKLRKIYHCLNDDEDNVRVFGVNDF